MGTQIITNYQLPLTGYQWELIAIVLQDGKMLFEVSKTIMRTNG